MFEIRTASETDIPHIVTLIREFAAFEKMDHLCEVTEEGLVRALFQKDATTRCVVATSEGDCVGYALFYPIFRSFRGVPSMYLEDLYVTPHMRGNGVGLQLVKAVARAAAAAGFRRMDWQVLKWNTEAKIFYESLGAENDDENLDFRLMDEVFLKLIE